MSLASKEYVHSEVDSERKHRWEIETLVASRIDRLEQRLNALCEHLGVTILSVPDHLEVRPNGEAELRRYSEVHPTR